MSTTASSTPTNQAAPKDAASSRPQILIAEDDAEMRSLIALTLKQYGYQVIECRDGIELLTRLHAAATNPEDQCDLVISDNRMPGASGLAVLNELSTSGAFLPVILITAFGDTETHAEALRLGAVACIDKPFDLDELLQQVHAVVPRAGPPAPD